MSGALLSTPQQRLAGDSVSSIISPLLVPVRYGNSSDQSRSAYTGSSIAAGHGDILQGAPSDRPSQPCAPWTPVAPLRSSSHASTPTYGTETPQGYRLSLNEMYESNSIHDTDSKTDNNTRAPLVQLQDVSKPHAGLPKLPLRGVQMESHDFSDRLQRWKAMESPR